MKQLASNYSKNGYDFQPWFQGMEMLAYTASMTRKRGNSFIMRYLAVQKNKERTTVVEDTQLLRKVHRQMSNGAQKAIQ